MESGDLMWCPALPTFSLSRREIIQERWTHLCKCAEPERLSCRSRYAMFTRWLMLGVCHHLWKTVMRVSCSLPVVLPWWWWVKGLGTDVQSDQRSDRRSQVWFLFTLSDFFPPRINERTVLYFLFVTFIFSLMGQRSEVVRFPDLVVVFTATSRMNAFILNFTPEDQAELWLHTRPSQCFMERRYLSLFIKQPEGWQIISFVTILHNLMGVNDLKH